MTEKEIEKVQLRAAKDLSKLLGWKFKRNFIYKVVDDFYYTAYFYKHRRENKLSGWLAFKPLKIDVVFWDIINEVGNKSMPLSFRAEAAFCINPLHILDFKIEVNNAENPSSEISGLLNEINQAVEKNSLKIKSREDYLNELFQQEEKSTSAIVTSLIGDGNYQQALLKIEDYKANIFHSGFGVLTKEGIEDFYDVAKAYIIHNTEKTAINPTPAPGSSN